MPSDLSTLDLATINAAQDVIAAALRDQCCQWEQESADAVADGRLSNAVMVQNWAFAADLLASKVASEFAALFGRALTARFGDLNSTTHRSTADQVMGLSCTGGGSNTGGTRTGYCLCSVRC